jgi:lysophospholipase L1-like esterase
MRRLSIITLIPACFLLWIGTAGAQTPSVPPAASTDCAELPHIKERLEQDESRLKDWANLGRYHDANARVDAARAGESRVVFMGDSITDGWSNPKYGGFFPGKAYLNRGIGGQTTPQMLIRFRPDVIALQPRAVVVLAGTNDISGNTGPTTLAAIEDNLAAMSDLARAHGIRVILASLLPVSDYVRRADGTLIVQTKSRPPAQITDLNRWIKQYAKDNGDVYLDYYTATVDERGMLKAGLSDDGLHPNAKGYAVMVPLAEAAIETALKK